MTISDLHTFVGLSSVVLILVAISAISVSYGAPLFFILFFGGMIVHFRNVKNPNSR